MEAEEALGFVICSRFDTDACNSIFPHDPTSRVRCGPGWKAAGQHGTAFRFRFVIMARDSFSIRKLLFLVFHLHWSAISMIGMGNRLWTSLLRRAYMLSVTGEIAGPLGMALLMESGKGRNASRRSRRALFEKRLSENCSHLRGTAALMLRWRAIKLR